MKFFQLTKLAWKIYARRRLELCIVGLAAMAKTSPFSACPVSLYDRRLCFTMWSYRISMLVLMPASDAHRFTGTGTFQRPIMPLENRVSSEANCLSVSVQHRVRSWYHRRQSIHPHVLHRSANVTHVGSEPTIVEHRAHRSTTHQRNCSGPPSEQIRPTHGNISSSLAHAYHTKSIGSDKLIKVLCEHSIDGISIGTDHNL